MRDEKARYGWQSDFDAFRIAKPFAIREALSEYIADASVEQRRAWADSIPPLQAEIEKSVVANELAREYSTILEYMLPMESRRPDVILLVGGSIMIVELKGKTFPSQADLDQVAAYARDLRNYHRECAGREVYPVLVPTRAHGDLGSREGVRIVGPDTIHAVVRDISAPSPTALLSREAFLADSAYRPLPTLVQAARELMFSGTLRTIDRARAATQPALEEISRIVHQAHLTRSRHLILLTGVPGAGKTLVGLQTVHARYLDDLSIARADGKPTTPAVYLSGNGPLVEVLQYEMRQSGGDGKTFVRGVKEYVKRYSARPSLVPPEHVLVFDEAQRAYDIAKMRESHGNDDARSEPEEFISFADRIPEWCVVLGLIGSGQEIHVGEEGGLGQWREAVENSGRSQDWTIHAPPALAEVFAGSVIPCETRPQLNLDKELRFHQAEDLHRFVASLLSGGDSDRLRTLAAALNQSGLHLRLTRDLDQAKQYLRDRYSDNPQARFGLVASSKDKSLVRFGVLNDFQSTKRVKFGPWYGDAETAAGSQSCRLLTTCVTEFGAQGLELDSSLLAWGTDLRRVHGVWSSELASGYRKRSSVKDPYQLRINAYRVLLTRGRDGTVIYVPPLREMDETYSFFQSIGLTEL